MRVNGMTITKKMLVDYISESLGALSVVYVDEFEGNVTRHICTGGNQIQVLQSNVFNVPLADGSNVGVEIFWCPNCRKVIINKSSLDLIQNY